MPWAMQQEVAAGEMSIYGTLLASGKGVLFLEGCKNGIWWLRGENAARSGGNGTGGIDGVERAECTDWRLRLKDLTARRGKRDLR